MSLRSVRIGALLAASLATSAGATSATAAPIRLADVARERGLDFVHDVGRDHPRWIVETMGSGACAGDFDGDGDDDLYLVNGGVLDPADPASRSARKPSRLYLNEAGRFRDATKPAAVEGHGWGMGCATADVEGDGDLDLFVTNVGPDELFLNDGHARFTEGATAAGLADPRWNTSAAFADHDGDGDLDLFVGAYVDFRLDGKTCLGPDGLPMICLPRDYAGVPGRLYRNDGGARYTNVTAELHAVEPSGKTLGVVFEDLTGDGRPDIYLANDTERNTLLVNGGASGFTDTSLAAGVGLSESGRALAGMGVDAGDLDGDGLPDLVVTNFHLETNSVWRSLGRGRWDDDSHASGMADASFRRLGFGVSMGDFDDDGDLDLFVANGHVEERVADWDPTTSYRQAHQVFENVSSPGRIRLREAAGALASPRAVGRGTALLDLEGDGDLDVVVSASGGAAQLLENRTAQGARWLEVRLAGPAPNTQGIGALVSVECVGRTSVRRVRTGGSYLSASPARAHFGLGAASSARVSVLWPDGTRQDAGVLSSGRVHVVRHPSSDLARPAVPMPPLPLQVGDPALRQGPDGPVRLRSGGKP